MRALSLVPAAFFALLLPAAAVGGGMALPVLASLYAIIGFRPSLLRQAVESRAAALGLLLVFTAWTAVTSVWSPVANHVQALKLCLLISLGLLFVTAASRSKEARRTTRLAALWGFALMVPALTIEGLWGMPINRFFQPDTPVGEVGRNLSRASTYLLATAWAVAGGLAASPWRLRWLAVIAVLAAAGALTLPFEQQADVIAFLIGAIVFAAAFALPRLMPLLVAGGLALWLLIAPFVTPLMLANQRFVDTLPLSWAARGGIWAYVCARIAEQPWIGHGLDASRAVTDRIQVRDLNIRAVPLHPHSASLQIWFETGAVGALLAAATLIAGGFALSRLYRVNRPAAAAASATLASLGLVANVSFGAWQEWWLATMFIAAALIAAIAAPSPNSTSSEG